MNHEFNELYHQIINEYNILPESQTFAVPLTELTPETIIDGQNIISYFDEIGLAYKMLNGKVRLSKPLRDLKDELITLRDNDVQLTAVEVEE